MFVTNRAPADIIASCVFVFGTGDPKLIRPGESVQVLGPPLPFPFDKIEGRTCYAVLTGIVICHSDPDPEYEYSRVLPGKPLRIEYGDASLIICHHNDKKDGVCSNPYCHVCDPEQK